MLVDYHMHLASDDVLLDDSVLTPGRVVQYTAAASAAGVDEIAITEHAHRFAAAAPLFDHPFWHEQARADLHRYADLLTGVRDSGLPVRAGLELDWLPGRERELDALVAGLDLDIVLGSVHWLDHLAVDHPDYAVWEHEEVDSVYRRYFASLRAAAGSGLFDVLAHADLAKVFGHRADASLVRREYAETADAIAASGCAVEISTAGRHKPAGELYPAEAFLRELRGRGVPITLASDAHRPEHVGRDLDQAVALARRVGYTTVTALRAREPRQEPLG